MKIPCLVFSTEILYASYTVPVTSPADIPMLLIFSGIFFSAELIQQYLERQKQRRDAPLVLNDEDEDGSDCFNPLCLSEQVA